MTGRGGISWRRRRRNDVGGSSLLLLESRTVETPNTPEFAHRTELHCTLQVVTLDAVGVGDGCSSLASSWLSSLDGIGWPRCVIPSRSLSKLNTHKNIFMLGSSMYYSSQQRLHHARQASANLTSMMATPVW